MRERFRLFLHAELLDFLDHVFDVLVDAEEVGVEDSLAGFLGGEAVELRERDILGFLLGDFGHVEG
jgi:hypothetical protein